MVPRTSFSFLCYDCYGRRTAHPFLAICLQYTILISIIIGGCVGRRSPNLSELGRLQQRRAQTPFELILCPEMCSEFTYSIQSGSCKKFNDGKDPSRDATKLNLRKGVIGLSNALITRLSRTVKHPDSLPWVLRKAPRSQRVLISRQGAMRRSLGSRPWPDSSCVSP